MKVRGAVVFIFATVLAGCAANDKIMVIHDVKTDMPSVTVIPEMVIPASSLGAYQAIDTSNDDMEFAAEIERDISRNGLKVYERPPFKFLETTSSSSGEVDQHNSLTSQNKATTIDVVAMYPDAQSDFIVVTYSASSRIRIIKKQDRSLVATFVVDRRDPIDMFNRVYSALAYAGLIKDVELSSCQLMERKAR